MNLVETEFKRLVTSRKGHIAMKMHVSHKQQFRHQFKIGREIKYSTMRKYLQRAGIRVDDSGYSRQQLVEVVKFAIGKNKFARSLGAAYLVEQWEKEQTSK